MDFSIPQKEAIDIRNTNVVVSASAGSGKTFLLNIIGKILEEQGRKIWYETMVFSQMGNKIWKHSSDFTDVVCLVDGLDEIYRYK